MTEIHSIGACALITASGCRKAEGAVYGGVAPWLRPRPADRAMSPVVPVESWELGHFRCLSKPLCEMVVLILCPKRMNEKMYIKHSPIPEFPFLFVLASCGYQTR